MKNKSPQKTHKEVLEESIGRFSSKQKAILKSVISAALMVGSSEIEIPLNRFCVMFDLKKEELIETLAAIVAGSIDEWFLDNGLLYFKWIEAAKIDTGEETITFSIHHKILECMRLHYSEEKERIELETL